MSDNILEIKNIFVEYFAENPITGQKQIVHAVNGLSLDIKDGEILAVAGESGCGKSTLAKAITHLEKPLSGEILYGNKDIFKMKKQELSAYRKDVQMVFQNPYSSLNPKMKIIDILKEPLKINTEYSDIEIYNIIKEKTEKVGLDINLLNRYPHEFSGGQRQRIAIARALMLNPKFIVADEPVSALDVSIQAQILNLIKELKREYKLTFLLITHDMGVIKYLADRVAVMYLGEIAELGSATQIFVNPKHPYTKALLSSVPKLEDTKTERISLKGELPSPSNLPDGCKFHTRCPHCMEVCRTCSPTDFEIHPGHMVKCFLYMNK